MSQIDTHTVPVPAKATRKASAPKPEVAKSAVDAVLVMIENAAHAGQIETLERLLKWRDAQIALDAELAFKDALATAQEQMTLVRPDSVNKHAGNSHYASLAAMDETVRKIYTAYGFGITFDTEDIDTPEIVRLICDVSHRDGYTRRYHINMPADGKGAKGGDVMTRTHATGSAITYGRRYLLGMIFNLAVARREDDDGNAAGHRLPQREAPRIDRRTPTFDELQRAVMGSPVQALPPKHRLEDEFHPHPEDRRPVPQRGPAPADTYNNDITNDARDAARKGHDAFRAFCTSITKGQYEDAVLPHLAEFKQLADLAIPGFLDRRAAR